MVYGHANGRDHEETVDAVGRYLEKGFKAIRVQSGVPGLEKVYGVGKGSGYYEPAQKGLPPEEPWDTSLYLRHTPELFRKVREAHGYDFHLLHDAHHRLTPIEAARLGMDCEPFRLFWIEDATPALVPEGVRTTLDVGVQRVGDERSVCCPQLDRRRGAEHGVLIGLVVGTKGRIIRM